MAPRVRATLALLGPPRPPVLTQPQAPADPGRLGEAVAGTPSWSGASLGDLVRLPF